MVRSLMDTQTIPEALDRYILKNVEGNPFYLEEVVNSLIDTGASSASTTSGTSMKPSMCRIFHPRSTESFTGAWTAWDAPPKPFFRKHRSSDGCFVWICWPRVTADPEELGVVYR
jgi:hypothetical protein